jgi:hypothetical protein
VPSSSAKQKVFWRIAAHSAKFREQHGIKEETAKEWYEADKRQDAERAEAERKRRATKKD